MSQRGISRDNPFTGRIHVVADTPPSALDVDRLATVLERMSVDCDPAADILHSTCDHDEHAARIAAAYEALA